MSFRALKSATEIVEARQRLERERLLPGRWTGGPRRWLRYLVQARTLPPPPDVRKSWDLVRAIEAIREAVPTAGTVLDLGAYNSAILPALARLGYDDLVGVDLNPKVVHGPHRGRIRYLVGDIYALPVPNASADAVTAISTMEHGWRGSAFFEEVARVLRPGGILLASTDYWPEKVDTSTLQAFGMPWSIFSADEIRDLLRMAASAGLHDSGEVDLSVGEPLIEWNERRYTFGFLRLVRDRS